MEINGRRIIDRLEELSQFGKVQGHGISRPFGTIEDKAARKWLIELWQKKLGVNVKIDEIANLWGSIAGTEKLTPIVLGSHHDTVLNGGKYDGALGVILATEVMQTILESGYKLRHPLKIVSFTAEEPNQFNLSTLGSRTVSGKLKREDIEKAEGIRKALEEVAGKLEKVQEARLYKNAMSAFIECHIEQGKRLINKGMSLAAVSKITGIYRQNITVVGEANHAGTTVMGDRRDALIAAAMLTVQFEKILKDIGRDDVVGTIGHLEVYPNSVNIIPGEVKLIIEFRTPEFEIAELIYKKLEEAIKNIEESRSLKIINEELLKQREVNMDKVIVDILKESSENELELVSMAGHDAAHMASLTKAAMLFVASVDGKSHCPSEYSKEEDIIKAGNVLLKTVIKLDKEID